MIPRSARRGSFLFILLVVFVVLILLHRSRFLLGLLFKYGERDLVFSNELLGPSNTLLWNETAIIPRIIHQTYKTEDIPEHWREGQQAVRKFHPNWEYMFWTDDLAHNFISTHYPAFLPTYTSYSYPIQRADALRYFLLYHYGGMYLDLDLIPYRPLTPLLQFPAFACLTTPTGISNDALGAVPRHPFYKLVIENLEKYNRNWGSGYVTVMYSTGPLFFSALWVEYLSTIGESASAMDRVNVLIREGEEGDSYGFFKNVQGGSWHGRDVEVIFWMGRHWVLVTLLGFMVGFGVTSGIWCVGRVLGRRWRGGGVDKRALYEWRGRGSGVDEKRAMYEWLDVG